MAPLYRLPTRCFEVSFAELLRDAKLSASASEAMIRYYSEVDTLNRGLDQIADLTGLPTTSGLISVDDVYRRNQLKAKEITKKGGRLYTDIERELR
jgi:hypothetical protein